MRSRRAYLGTQVPTQPHVARVYDYLLGGKDNYGPDRVLGNRILAKLPQAQAGALAQRAVLGRVVRYLVGEAGIRQLLDIGSGLPTAENVHQIAQRIDPATRVAYLDNDHVVLAHARALLAENAVTVAVEGDLRHPAAIITSPELREFLNWQQPIGLLMCGILHYLADSDDPAGVTSTLIDALPPGSYVFIHHLLDTHDPESAALAAAMASGLEAVRFRTLEHVASFFGGLELVPPGLVPVTRWRPDPETPSPESGGDAVLRLACAGVGRKA